ncbi:DsbA family protein [Nocardioides piscis]|uniref:DsbA family protein n=1 Tax=Nocardioides piscis TaxID=2714938 RepID=A0A6G7YK72_9ACTN|nr:thioredoxin domain-containing protein [Nocardioides piscis]QIK77135.1 DsbA family protein [Nocardioides piscis]
MAKSNREKRAERAARAKAERAERLRKEKQRRRLTYGGVGLALALVVGLAVWWVSNSFEIDETAAVPDGATSSYGLKVGEANAEREVVIYEDFICPACRSFEEAFDGTLETAVEDGTATVEYRVLNFLDRFGDYSERSANAFAVVLDAAGPEVAKEFHDILYAEQPPEDYEEQSADDADYPDDAWLIEKAVEAGAEESAVADGIEDLAFADWVANGVKAASSEGIQGTPTVLVDGQAIEQDQLPAALE